jgi:serine protease Do
LQVGELAVAIGNPTGKLSGTVTAGIISALDRTVEGFAVPLIQTDATINPGNSGGALINSFGEVIGINTLKIFASSVLSERSLEGLSFAIPIDEAKPIIEQLIQNGKVARPAVGVIVATISEDVAKLQNLTPGVLVRQVSPGSSADLAGIVVGDIIVKFGGQEIKTSEELREVRDSFQIGDEVEVELVRNGTKTITVTLILQEG